MAVYAFIVIAAGLLFWAFLNNIKSVIDAAVFLYKPLQPFLYGLIIAYLLNPIVKRLEKLLGSVHKLFKRYRYKPMKKKLKRGLSVAFAYLITLLILGIFFSIVIPQLIESLGKLANEIPNYVNSVQEFLSEKSQILVDDIDFIDFEEIMLSLGAALREWTNDLTVFIPNVIALTKNVTGFFINFLIGVVISVYMLFSKEFTIARFKKVLYAIFPKKFMDRSILVIRDSDKVFSNFVIGKVIDSLIVGILNFIFMTLSGMPYAMLISVVVAVLNIIPYFGAIAGPVIGALILFVINPVQAIIYSVFGFILQQVDGNIISPKILGDAMGLDAFLIIFAVITFGSVFGMTGALLGVPLFAVMYTIFSGIIRKRLKKKNLPENTNSYMDDISYPEQ